MGGAGGITPLDLLTGDIPRDQRQIISWLSRRKQATLPHIQEAMQAQNHTPEKTESALEKLIEAGYVNQALVNGELCYRVAFKGQVRRMGTGLPDDIWARIDLDRIAFMKTVPLFQGLTEEQINEIAAKMTEERYQRGDVLLFQGKSSDRVFFIKSGIVGITRIAPQSREEKVLAYIRQGDILGEYNAIAGPSGVASATAYAMSTVFVLSLKRADFIDMLNAYPRVAIELARLLATRLLAVGSRPTNARNARVVLVITTGVGVGGTLLSTLIALTLNRKTGQSVAFTELPDSRRLQEHFPFAPESDIYTHPGGYEVVMASGASMLPPATRATLMMDQLFMRYENIIVTVPATASDIIGYLCGFADQIVLLATPDPESLARLGTLSGEVRGMINPEKVDVFLTINRVKESYPSDAPIRADFDLPFATLDKPHQFTDLEQLPPPLANFAGTLVDRLGRTNSVSLYIPTTIDVNTQVDTSEYVNRTLAFLGGMFGGATATTKARGVWNSAEAGLVHEDIFIVRSYATQTALDSNLQRIIDYVEQMKVELRQEAMAVEINQKLMLI